MTPVDFHMSHTAHTVGIYCSWRNNGYVCLCFALSTRYVKFFLDQHQWPKSEIIFSNAFCRASVNWYSLIKWALVLKCRRCSVCFRTSHSSALPVKRLWQFLVKQEEVQETFIRHIFTKKRDPNEVHCVYNMPTHCMNCLHVAQRAHCVRNNILTILLW